MKTKINFFLAIFIILFLVIPVFVFAQEQQEQGEDDLKKAQWYYHHENYEEALPLFKNLKDQNPNSSEIAYYLGLTYKQLQSYLEAVPYFVEAITFDNPVEQAVLDLIDLLYQCEKFEDAKKWIAFAEKNFISPGQASFFKGLILLKEGNDYLSALDAFENAVAMDTSLVEPVKYQKAICYTQLNDLKAAKQIFKEIVIKDPTADLAVFSNEYLNAISRRQDSTKPFHASVGYSLQYDDNVVFRPNDDALATSISEESDLTHVFTAQADYNFKLSDFFSLKVGGNAYSSKHNSIGFYDVNSYDFPIQPTLYFKNSSIAFPVHYNYVAVNEQRYLETSGSGIINNVMLTKTNMLQNQFQFNNKDYKWDLTDIEENKEGNEYLWSMGWYNFFGRELNGFVNLRYTFNYDDTKGKNWRYQGNRLTFTSVVPFKKVFNWNFVADYLYQDFEHRNSSYDKNRQDHVFTVSNLLSWEFIKNGEIDLQHTFVYDSASIGAYKYKKNIYSLGSKYRF